MFKGLITALVTPFLNGEVDYNSIKKLVEFQLSKKVDGLLILGSTAEAVSLDYEEREKIIKLCIDIVKSSIPIIVGTSHSSTFKTLKYTQKAKELKADGALIVCPFYNKPTQEGVYLHYKYINDNVDFPLIVYNNPARSIIDINHQTLLDIVKLKNIVGIKDSTSDLNRPQLLQKHNNQFTQLSGEDSIAVAFNLYGGEGCISVLSNALPSQLSEIQALTRANDYVSAQYLHLKYHRLIELCFCETNPIPIKYMAYKLGLIESYEMRLPLTKLSFSLHEKIDSELCNLGLI